MLMLYLPVRWCGVVDPLAATSGPRPSKLLFRACNSAHKRPRLEDLLRIIHFISLLAIHYCAICYYAFSIWVYTFYSWGVTFNHSISGEDQCCLMLLSRRTLEGNDWRRTFCYSTGSYHFLEFLGLNWSLALSLIKRISLGDGRVTCTSVRWFFFVR